MHSATGRFRAGLWHREGKGIIAAYPAREIQLLLTIKSFMPLSIKRIIKIENLIFIAIVTMCSRRSRILRHQWKCDLRLFLLFTEAKAKLAFGMVSW